jgi:hypothetical protein
VTKEEYFNRGREDHINGAEPMALKEGSWQHTAYVKGWVSYNPSRPLTGITASAEVAKPSLRHIDRIRRSLQRRADALARKLARRKHYNLWLPANHR